MSASTVHNHIPSARPHPARQLAALAPEPAPRTRPEPADTAPVTGADNRQDGEEQDDGFSFWDLLDIVNPLQHIPVVNRIYRAVTGDEIKTPAKLAGSALFWGPVGFGFAAADALLEEVTGKDAFEHVTSLFDGDDPAAPDPNTPAGPLLAQAPDSPTAARGLAGPELAGSELAGSELAGSELTRPDLGGLPGASAAGAALAGLPAAAALATLPAPGDGTPAPLLAALTDGGRQGRGVPSTAGIRPGTAATRDDGGPTGLDMAAYWAQARGGFAPPPKSFVPPAAEQTARAEKAAFGGRATGSGIALARPQLPPAALNLALAEAEVTTAETLARPVGTDHDGDEDGDRAGDEGRERAPWPPGGPTPLPKELVADAMLAALDKYRTLKTGAALGR